MTTLETYRRAKQCLHEGNLEESFELFTNFIDGFGKSALTKDIEELKDAYNSRGHIRYKWVEFDKAVCDYTEAIKLDSNFAVAFYNRGQIHYRLGRYIQAKTDLEQSLQIQPGFSDAQIYLQRVNDDLAKGHQFNVAGQST